VDADLGDESPDYSLTTLINENILTMLSANASSCYAVPTEFPRCSVEYQTLSDRYLLVPLIVKVLVPYSVDTYQSQLRLSPASASAHPTASLVSVVRSPDRVVVISNVRINNLPQFRKVTKDKFYVTFETGVPRSYRYHNQQVNTCQPYSCVARMWTGVKGMKVKSDCQTLCSDDINPMWSGPFVCAVHDGGDSKLTCRIYRPKLFGGDVMLGVVVIPLVGVDQSVKYAVQFSEDDGMSYQAEANGDACELSLCLAYSNPQL
jgi:C2 domain